MLNAISRTRSRLADRLGWRGGGLAFLLLTGTWLASGPASLAAAEAPRRVLVLYTMRAMMPIVAAWDRGIRAGFASDTKLDVRLDAEFLDLFRVDEPGYVKRWLDLLRLKYDKVRFDAVIAVYDPAARLALEHQADILHGAPLVLCSVYHCFAEQLAGTPNVAMVAYYPEIGRTLQAARKYRPQLRRVVLVDGSTPLDQGLASIVKQAIVAECGLQCEVLAGLSTEELCRKVERLPADAIVLFVGSGRDRDGHESISATEVLPSVAESSTVPLVSFYDSLLGHGILGGCLIRVEPQGRLAAEAALRILHGEKAESLPIRGRETSVDLYDWRQMQRWRIRESDLPPGSTIVFREPTFWQNYWHYVLLGGAMFLVQSLLVVGLLLGMSRRRRIEAKLAGRLAFESFLHDLTTRFMDVEPHEAVHELDHAVERICRWLDADRGALYQLSPDGAQLRRTHVWAKPGIALVAEAVGVHEAAWGWGVIRSRMIVVVGSPDALPDDAQFEKALLARMGVNAAMVIPLVIGEKVQGLLALGNAVSHTWQESSVQRARILGGLLARVLAHARADAAQRASHAETVQLSRRLLTAREDEQRRLARDMHDDFTQRLATLAVESGKLAHRAAGQPDMEQGLGRLRENLVRLSDDVRDLSRQLHPAILEDLGLAEAVRTECEGVGRRHDIAVDFRCRDLPAVLEPGIAVAAYRIVQEALRNLVQHAAARRAAVALTADDEFLYVDVQDFGRGFDVAGSDRPRGIGLVNMEERARLVGGRLTLVSQPGAGTTVSLRVPLQPSTAH